MSRASTALLVAALLAAVAPAQERVLHTMIHAAHFEASPTLRAIADEFGRKHGVRVEILSASGSSSEGEKIKIQLTAGLPLDVTWIDVQEFGGYLAEDALLDLQPFFDEDAKRGAWDPADYFEQPLRALTDERGHLYGLPSTFTPYVMYYNRDLLEAAGLGPPPPDWSWDDLLRIARRTTRDTDGDGHVDQWGISLTQWLQALVPWIWQNGGDVLDEDGRRSRMNEPAAVEAVEWLVRLLHEERVASSDATFENQFTQGLFQAGRAALYGPVGYWETYRFKNIRDFRWDVVPLPRRKQAATAIAMRSYVVPRGTRHPELAYRFVRELAGDTMQRTLARIGNGVPGLRRAAYSADFLKPEVPPEGESVFLEVMERGGARFLPPRSQGWKISDLCEAELQGALLLGRRSGADACARIAAKVDAFLAKDAEVRSRPALPRGSIPLAGILSVPVFAAAFLLLRGRAPRALGRRQERAAGAFLALWAVGFLVLVVAPMAVSLVLSLSEWSPLRSFDGARWMGLENFRAMAGDDTLHDSLRVTALYALLAVPLTVAAALGLALLVRRPFPGAGVARTIFYLPTVVSPVIVGAVWRWILDQDRGLLNRGLRAAGLDGPAWLSSERWILPAFVLMGLWMAGAQMLVFLAALQSLDPALDDAARLDGAGRWRRFLHVTLPQLSPVVFFNVVVGVIAAFQIFAQPFVMTQGGPGNASRFLVLYMYDTAFKHLSMGYASAIAWLLFGLVLAVTLLLLWSSRRWVHYEGRA